jgi:perosamine synthetase
VIPYGRQSIDDDDIQAVVEVLKSDWLTTGPNVERFEKAVADYVGAEHGVAFCNGTAALHGMMFALGIDSGDEVITTPMTFAASANCVVYQGGIPVFCDVDGDSLLIDPEKIKSKINKNTRAVIAVDFAGQPCGYDELKALCDDYGLALLADSCHAIGAEYKGKKAGALAEMTAFSFHPVKHVTTGEGGMVTTDNEGYAQRLRLFRNHGITTDFRQRQKLGGWFYEMEELGYNYRITDIQCALGASQLRKLSKWIKTRNKIAKRYDEAFSSIDGVVPLKNSEDVINAYHLYVVRIKKDIAGKGRAEVFAAMRDAGIGVNVHYVPVYLHPYYQKTFGYGQGLCPVAENAYEEILSLPMFPALTTEDQQVVINSLIEICSV